MPWSRMMRVYKHFSGSALATIYKAPMISQHHQNEGKIMGHTLSIINLLPPELFSLQQRALLLHLVPVIINLWWFLDGRSMFIQSSGRKHSLGINMAVAYRVMSLERNIIVLHTFFFFFFSYSTLMQLLSLETNFLPSAAECCKKQDGLVCWLRSLRRTLRQKK